MEQELKPGPHQSVDTVLWPEHGQGKLVWRNGPAFFVPDSGAPTIPLFRADMGGSSSGPPPRSYERIWVKKEGPCIEVDLVARGELHSKRWSPIFGQGWLVTERTGFWERFEDEAGNVKVRFEASVISSGRPDYVDKMKRSGSRMPKLDDPDEFNWITMRSRDGSVFVFRRGEAPPPEGTFIPLVHPQDYALLTPKARKAYDAAKKQHEADRARQLQLPPNDGSLAGQ